MNYKISVLLNFLGLLFWLYGFAMLHFFGATGDIAFVILLSFGTVLILVGFVGGIIGIVKGRKGKGVEEKRKKEYFEAHPQEKQ